MLITASLLTALLTALPQPGPPGDKEIRVSKEGSIVLTTLTLMLRGTGGPLSINLVLAGRQDPSRPQLPATFDLMFYMPLYTGPVNATRPHYQLKVGNRTPDHVLTEGNVDERMLFSHVDVVRGPFDVIRLSELAGAGAASGHVLGAVFILGADQIAAVGEFADRVLKGQ